MTRIIKGVLDFQKRVFGKKRELFQQLGVIPAMDLAAPRAAS